jgi:hypothetical protein
MGFGIKKEAGSNTTPSDIVNFDKLTPTTVGVVFDPDTPATEDILYVSSVDASTWIWNGTAYITYSPPATATTEWYLNGTTIDAGSNKTAAISRNNSIYVLNNDSLFNSVRVGRGRNNIVTNTVVGVGNGNSITTGANNTFIGYSSGYSNTTASTNTFVGNSSGLSITNGGNNSFFGSGSGYTSTTGTDNVFIGKSSGFLTTTGTDNTFLSSNAGYYNTTGSYNTFVGRSSGSFTADGVTFLRNANYSVFLGSGTKALADNQSNQIVIGYNTIGKGSNTVNIGNTSITNTYLNGAVTFNNAFTFPTTDGTANYFLKTDGSGTVTWGVAGLSFFSEAQSTTAPNATVYANSLTAVSTTTNADFVIRAKGTGAILARVPDNTGNGGNKRGQYALDFSRYEGASGAYIAAGDYDIILGGTRNSSATGTFAFIGNGDYNNITGTYGTILNGNNNSVTGARGIVVNGQYNQANGAGSVAIGGLYNYANGGSSVALGGGNTASGTSSFATGSATTASGILSFSANNGSLADGYSSNAFGDYGWANGIRAKFAIGASGWGYGTTQAAITQLDARTTTNTPTVLLANTQNAGGILASTQFTLPNNSLMRVKGSIQGKQSASTNCGVWDFDAVLVRGATASTIIIAGTPSISLVVNTGGFGNPTITANTSLGCMTVTVTGLAATNIQWACRIDSTETLYA